MKLIKQLFWIVLFSLLGEIISTSVSSIVAVPGSVIGMVLLFFALHFKILKLNQVEEVGTWLTDNMAIFFVPAGVGLMTNFELLGEVWLQLLIIMIVTTAIMMWFVGTVVQKAKRHFDQKKPNTVERKESNA